MFPHDRFAHLSQIIILFRMARLIDEFFAKRLSSTNGMGPPRAQGVQLFLQSGSQLFILRLCWESLLQSV
jgi:hypothetical protein